MQQTCECLLLDARLFFTVCIAWYNNKFWCKSYVVSASKKVHIYIFLRPILVYVSLCGSGKRKIDMFSQENVNDK